MPLNDIQLSASEIAPLMCPGIAGYAAFKLAEVEKGDKLGLYGFGPTAHCILKIAQSLGIESYVSTRATKNIESASREGANWVGDTSQEKMPCTLDSARHLSSCGESGRTSPGSVVTWGNSGVGTRECIPHCDWLCQCAERNRQLQRQSVGTLD